MDPSYIKPFIQSIQHVFATMLQVPVMVGAPRPRAGPGSSFEVLGVIAMTGGVVGSVVLGFPRETARRVVSLLCGRRLEEDDPDFADALGELVSMVSGGAKALFPITMVSISCPSVVIGAVAGPGDQTERVVLPCTTDCGDLAIELALWARPAQSAPQPNGGKA